MNIRRLCLATCITAAIFTAGAVSILPNRMLYTGAFLRTWLAEYEPAVVATLAADDEFFRRLSAAALERPKLEVRYDGRYIKIPYPNGDVPSDIGVCSDEVVRSYRALGIDLQRLVHEDMAKNFKQYPQLWKMERPDSNIDHRRVPNLMVFFRKFGTTLPVSNLPQDYRAGDLVVWRLVNGLLHIGIVVDGESDDGLRPLIVHNIGEGPKLEDALFVGTIVAHFRYKPERALNLQKAVGDAG